MDPPAMAASNGAHSPVGAAPQEQLRGPETAGDVAAPPHAPVETPNFQPSVHNPASKESPTRGIDPSSASALPAAGAGGMIPELNPRVVPWPVAPPSSFKDTMETVRNVLSLWGKKIEESARKAEDLSRNTWQHLKIGPSLTEAAMGRIAQGTKIIAEGGYENIFHQTFETLPEEQLRKSYACYLSTSAGPVMGVLYLSSAKLAFCSDSPLSYKAENKTEWSYYKVVIPLHQLRACNPSISRTNSAEKYIQIVSVNNHEFWFMGFLNYSDAVQTLQDTMQEVRGSAV